ncbi:MAG: S41 family peptidase [Bacillota bacterium]|nr:S41 family peptidase [Bacillota bacterium]
MRRKALLLTVIALLVLSNVGTYLISTGQVPWIYQRGTIAGKTPEYRSFLQVLGYIQGQFVDEARAQNDALLIRGATRGMVEALDDPYSVYMDPQQYTQFVTGVRGNYTGVGIEITSVDGYITVIAPIKDTPAYRVGILPQDRIVAVDGRSIIGFTTQEASELIRGAEGTAVVLTIRRGDSTQPVDYSIVRELIQLRTVFAKMLEAGIGYLQISAFREDTAADCERALTGLRQEGLRVLILDLRDNPGGLLDQAVQVAGLFVPQGRVVTTLYRDGRREEHDARGPGLGLPLITLVNGGSASASEIVSGAIQDRQAGTLLGVKTFGKALVQHLFTLPDGGGLKLSTARYLTPNGRDINRAEDGTGGIVPDVVVENGAVDPGRQRVQLDDVSDPRNLQLRQALELARQRAG